MENQLNSCSYLIQTLKEISSQARKFYSEKSSEIQYAGIEDFIFRNGRIYNAQKLPDKYQRMKKQECFSNCTVFSLKYDLVYVEGYACLERVPFFPVHHAWCVEIGSNEVIDPTIDDMAGYIGVPFTREYLLQHQIESQFASLLDDWKRDFPVLRMTQKQLQEILVPDIYFE